MGCMGERKEETGRGLRRGRERGGETKASAGAKQLLVLYKIII